MDGGISFIEACERLDSQFNTVTREVTQSSGVTCGESSSESVATPWSLNSQACSFSLSPVEPHMISKDHLICASWNTVHRSSARTRTEKHERIVTTTPSINTRLPIRSLKCSERPPSRLWRSRNNQRHSTPLSALGTRINVRSASMSPCHRTTSTAPIQSRPSPLNTAALAMNRQDSALGKPNFDKSPAKAS